MQLTIYFDLVIIINLVMNYLLLWTTARLIKIDYRIWQLSLSAICGTVYTILILFPEMRGWNNIVMYFVISIIMVNVAYIPIKIKKFFKAIGYFYLITFLAAGILMAGYNLNVKSQFSELTGNVNLSLQDTWIFLFSIFILWIVGKFSWRIFQGQVSTESFLVDLFIKFDNQSLKLEGLVDTGNQLSDPLTKTPVIIVELETILDILPENILNIFTEYDLESEIEEIAAVLSNTSWAKRFRLIPFSAIGSQNGLLIGLKPDKVILNLYGEEIVTQSVIIGIYDQQFNQEVSYTALVNPKLVNVAVHN
ncbi:sigma-E processing peptidase SpoIIGA [Selenihalanaerobacter shriftii]|uniref:Sporulation sigma-E factor-processing peptidase n=1 Tax=Selenihalanaerobacter shriftii TaxID=142842 RepID=A0A1T4K008_9FIRM|nr:sigma-E processing peptidase SpoIIGA [Selenihalanaerobacter shriftii]SJZ35709.1 stage II sporulation protein GA (sporulation sigma-E factor processing peptidase) [Selenihalanaerobacter shriftii]